VPRAVRRKLPILREIPLQCVSFEKGLEIALDRFRTGSGDDS
jgi:hypothetical protein